MIMESSPAQQQDGFEKDPSFIRARELESIYQDRYVYTSRFGHKMKPKRNVQQEKSNLINSLINPETGQPYTRDELDSFYLFHIVSGGDISMGFPMEMQLDTPNGEFENFILSLAEAPLEHA